MVVPKPIGGGTYTVKGFFGWLRSQLRRASLRWKPRADALKEARRPYTGENKRRKWEYQCSVCGEWCNGKDVQADHIKPCGTLTCYDDLPKFVERLFCEVDGFRVLCKPCHLDITNKERATKHG